MSRTLKTMLTRIRNRHFLLLDVLVLVSAPLIAYTLRTDRWPDEPVLLVYVAYSLVLRLLVFWWAGFYSHYWRSASMDELGTLVVGNVAAAILVSAVYFGLRLPALDLCTPWPDVCSLPRSQPLISSLLVFVGVTGPRLAARYLTTWLRHHASPAVEPGAAERVLVAGAGEMGLHIVDEMYANPQLGMQPVGFVDDDPHKLGMQIRGIPVLGTLGELGDLLAVYAVQQVIIAMPSAPGKVVRSVRDQCQTAGVKTRIIPGLDALIDGRVSVSRLRKVEIEDLLRRAPVAVDLTALHAVVRGRRVLVTGGGGSIGSELCRQLLRCNPAELVVLGHGENSVFEIIQELQRSAEALAAGQQGGSRTLIHSAIADVRFPDRILDVFRRFRPQIVFHAAAHKHVPLMEEHPGEAVTNNILGTANVVAASQAVGVERFVMISSDKAVRPTSVMGASKRVAELLVRRAALRTGLPYVAVRFGNVLGSRGSVVLTFKQQIERGGPVTVTDPEMRRYFMTIPEAVQLVLQAAQQGQGGEVFMLEMGEPVKIVDLARDLIELSGLQVGRDIDIVFSGARPGEKLFEELFLAGEHYTPTAHPRIFSAGNGNLVLPADLDAALGVLAAAAAAGDDEAVRCGLRGLVPEYAQPRPSLTPTAGHRQPGMPLQRSPAAVGD